MLGLSPKKGLPLEKTLREQNGVDINFDQDSQGSVFLFVQNYGKVKNCLTRTLVVNKTI